MISNEGKLQPLNTDLTHKLQEAKFVQTSNDIRQDHRPIMERSGIECRICKKQYANISDYTHHLKVHSGDSNDAAAVDSIGHLRLTFSYVFAISSTLDDFLWHCLFHHLSIIFFAW